MDTLVKTVCPYCGVGCGLVAKVRGRRILEVRGDKDHPSTRGGICPKGAQIDQIVHTQNRLTAAHWRSSRGEDFQPVGHDVALAWLAEKFKEVIGLGYIPVLRYYLTIAKTHLFLDTFINICQIFRKFNDIYYKYN